MKTPLGRKIFGFVYRLPKKAKPHQILSWHRVLFFLFFYNLYLVIFMGNQVFPSHLHYLAYVTLVYDIFYCKFSLRPIPTLWNKFAFPIGFLGGCFSLLLVEPTSGLYGSLALSVIFGTLFTEKPLPLRLASALTYGFVGVNLALVLPFLPIIVIVNSIVLIVAKFRFFYLSFQIFPEKGKQKTNNTSPPDISGGDFLHKTKGTNIE